MNNKNILIVTAHLDVVEIGMGGTCAKLCEHNNVTLVVMCKGNRPGKEHVAIERQQATRQTVSDFGIRNLRIHDYNDVFLDIIPQIQIANLVSNAIQTHKPHIVYTHNCDDVHEDHRVVANATRVATRMRQDSTVNELYEFQIPGSSEWNFKPTIFNVFNSITDEHHKKKHIAISRYLTEIREYPDPISLASIDIREKHIGSICGYPRAEAFKQIFKRT